MPASIRSDRLSKSHPSRVRGLKYKDIYPWFVQRKVAPFTGAWIEINYHDIKPEDVAESHPSRVRGLKLMAEGPD